MLNLMLRFDDLENKTTIKNIHFKKMMEILRIVQYKPFVYRGLLVFLKVL